jgi:hypothetical protein
MRTKTLLLTAALSVAGIATSFAQVYSVNAVGYVNVNLDTGLNLICNPLKNTAGNELNNILPLPDSDAGTTVWTYNGSTFVSSTFLGAPLGWTPNNVVAPGQGLFISVSAGKTVTFVGEVPQGADSNLALTSGLSLISSPVPQALALDAMGYPAADGDTVYFYRGAAGSKAYASSTFITGLGWVPAAVPNVGEGFWASRSAAGNWTRNFNVNAP